MKNTRIRASEELKREFARRLRKQLVSHNMNQSELANRIDLTKDAVSTYMRARSLPSPPTLRRISSVFGVEPTDLLPQRFDYANEAPIDGVLAFLMLGNGMAELSVKNLAAPVEVLLPIFEKLREFVPGAGRHG